MPTFKMVFLGESEVGKSAIIGQKVSHKFKEEYTETSEDYFVSVHRINVEDINHSYYAQNGSESSTASRASTRSRRVFSNRFDQDGKNYNELPCYHCVLDILDTSGSLDRRINLNQWLWRAQIFVVVFDVTNRSTFDNLETSFISHIVTLRKCAQPPIVLVGTKCDLINKDETISAQTSSNDETPGPSPQYERQVTMDMIEELCNKYNILYTEVNVKDRTSVNRIFDLSIKERVFHEAYHQKQTFMLQKANADKNTYGHY
eukprot:CAMPEP_0202691996 /NCGR_PEP_ID=MMETSP1385-20130828/6513_1 /ASSEMBLY_ACC=CAM_ASM_000861 /TAXON_ID=933848 /ORGANISM="Elphidium margaritaceum" /LENGTH=259 /DNA_ID=CAMNT_0049347461 /DNA_START=210 /DNA_END=989 /DNA_ORIENTATION=+